METTAAEKPTSPGWSWSSRYRIPAGVHPVETGRHDLLTTRQGGQVWIDRRVFELWKDAADHTLAEILDRSCGLDQDRRTSHLDIRAGLACLAEAGLLEREGQTAPADHISEQRGELVSVIIVSYNSLAWLPDCLDSLAAQSYSPLEIIVVDNASQDGSAAWVEKNYPQVRLISLEQTEPFARALNVGMRSAGGKYYLLLNPDVHVRLDAIAQLVQTARTKPGCAAVSAKLRLLWAPSFLNGVGNLVGAISWGTDIGLGHLDLGQFAGWDEIPSACFAAALIPAQAIESVGPLDEGFPLYYEDSEWCYRARLFGFSIHTASDAVVDHAFSGQRPAEKSDPLTPAKLRRVSAGRLRFITCINGTGYFWSFLFNYALEDTIRSLVYLIRGRRELARSIRQGWGDYLHSLPKLLHQRAEVQARRQPSDRALYRLQNHSPIPHIRSGCPQLTWEAICAEYLPLILAGRTRRFPEFALDLSGALPSSPPGFWKRAALVWEAEGPGGLIRWASRHIQWKIMQP